MLNNMFSMVKNFGLGKYFDKYGYNVLEMSYSDYVSNIDLVTSFVDASDDLNMLAIDDFGNEVVDQDFMDEATIIVYSKKVWEENGLI